MSAHYETVISLSQFEHSTYVFFCQLTFWFKYHTFPLLYVFTIIRHQNVSEYMTKFPKLQKDQKSGGWKVQKSCHVYQKMAWNAFSLKTFASRFHLIRTSFRNVWNIFEEACGHSVILEPMNHHYINETVLEYIKMYRNTSKYVKHSISKNDLTSFNLKL